MTVTAVTGYQVSLFLHITAALVGLGATFAMAIAFPLALRMDPRHLPYVHRLSLRISEWLVLPAVVVLLATGFYQVSKGDWKLGDLWLSAALGIVAVLALLTVAYFIPADRRLEAMVQREVDAAGPGADVSLSEDYQRQAQREGGIGALTGVLVVIVVYLMVVKPGM
ncbi:MAG: hypothetical protein QOE65_1073 [Solirubrobacteraceae bacterium]|jgi:hypothetical protein|nr:hypothetical protein [Solirubrobacteraceae bacterium]